MSAPTQSSTSPPFHLNPDSELRWPEGSPPGYPFPMPIPLPTFQSYWYHCEKCSGLAYFGAQRCVAGGAHDHSASYNYSLTMGTNRNGGQSGWKCCRKCNELSYAGGGVAGCVAQEYTDRGPIVHDFTGSADYMLMINKTNDGRQDLWRWCKKCQGLNYGAGNPGPCLAGGTHDNSGSGDYSLAVNGNAGENQNQWRWCSKCQLLSYEGYSSCPSGEMHISKDSRSYSVAICGSGSFGPSVDGAQQDWKCCSKCYGLVYAEQGYTGSCPRLGTHDTSNSIHGKLPILQPANSGRVDSEGGWSRCGSCQSLWRSNPQGAAPCPSGPSATHVVSDVRENYYVPISG